MHQVICWFVYIGKNPRFTAFLKSNLHTRLVIVTANELGLAFPPRNLPKKFRPDPSTFYLVIVVTIRYDTRCYFNVRSKADISQLNLPHGTDN